MYLSNQSLLVIIVVGIVAGWLAGRVMEGGSFGLIGDLIAGLLGAFYRRLVVAATRHSPWHWHHRVDHKRLRWGGGSFADFAVGDLAGRTKMGPPLVDRRG